MPLSILSAVRLQQDVIPRVCQPGAYSATLAAMIARLAPRESIRSLSARSRVSPLKSTV